MNKRIKGIVLGALALIMCVSMVGCGAKTSAKGKECIDFIKNSNTYLETLEAEVNLGAAFDDYFKNVKWEHFYQEDPGRDIVEFNGKATGEDINGDVCYQFYVDLEAHEYYLIYGEYNGESLDEKTANDLLFDVLISYYLKYIME